MCRLVLDVVEESIEFQDCIQKISVNSIEENQDYNVQCE